jgi:hypothetical protein
MRRSITAITPSPSSTRTASPREGSERLNILKVFIILPHTFFPPSLPPSKKQHQQEVSKFIPPFFVFQKERNTSLNTRDIPPPQPIVFFPSAILLHILLSSTHWGGSFTGIAVYLEPRAPPVMCLLDLPFYFIFLHLFSFVSSGALLMNLVLFLPIFIFILFLILLLVVFF